MSHGPNVEGQGVGLLGRRRNGEGMPLKVGDGGDVQVDVVTLGRKLLSSSQCQELGQKANLAPDWFFVFRQPIRSQVSVL